MVHAVAGIRAADTSGVGPGSVTELKEAPTITWRDVADTLNPLTHIPFVSTLYNEMTDHTPSAAPQLAGGMLLGGPIGFLIGLANVVFQDQTGKGVGGTLLAALTGDESEATTQLAAADEPEPAAEPEQELASIAPMAAPVEMGVISSKDNAVLDLYGGSASSAHSSYQKAQMLPYLNDVTVSKVL
jgi:hypothetical protein